MNNKVPFNQLRYGTRFKYREDDKQVFVRLGHDLVADWDGTLHAVACNLQGLYCFKDDTTPLDTPVCVIENADPVPPAGGEPVIYALSRYNDSGGFSPSMVQRETLPEPETHEGYVVEEDHRAHVTRLQAEVEQLTGDLQEVARQHGLMLGEVIEERDTLKAEVKLLKEGKVLVEIAASQVVKAKESLQSELTKARELLKDIRQCNANEVWPVIEEIDTYLSNQSAPALIETLRANGDLIAMEATIAQQAQRIADLEAGKGRGEPVAWLVESPSDLEPINGVAYTKEHADMYRAGRWTVRPVYAEQPAPVTVVPFKVISLPPSLTGHHAFDVLRDELAKVGVQVREPKP